MNTRPGAACASQGRIALASPPPKPRRTLPVPGPTPIAALSLLKSRFPTLLAGLLRTERGKGAPPGMGRVGPHPYGGRGDSGRHPSPTIQLFWFCLQFSMLVRLPPAHPRRPGLYCPSTDAGDHRICRHVASSQPWAQSGDVRFAKGSFDRSWVNISWVVGTSTRILKRTTIPTPHLNFRGQACYRGNWLAS